jgi:hypothetical protein
MNKDKIRVALLIDKAGSYDRGLIREIIHYSNLNVPWDFFLEAPNFAVLDEKKQLINRLKIWRRDCIIMNESFFEPEFTTWGIPILVTPSRKLKPGVINIIADALNTEGMFITTSSEVNPTISPESF